MKLRIYENLICELRSEELNEGGDHRRLYRQLLQLRKESLKKNSGLYGIRILDLCDTALFRPVRCTGITEVKGSNPTYVQVRT